MSGKEAVKVYETFARNTKLKSVLNDEMPRNLQADETVLCETICELLNRSAIRVHAVVASRTVRKDQLLMERSLLSRSCPGSRARARSGYGVLIASNRMSAEQHDWLLNERLGVNRLATVSNMNDEERRKP